jgi:transcriptional regulator with XRE-family HTH domain
MNIQRLFATNLRRLRQASGLSQSRFAVLSNVDRTHLNKLEMGRKTPTLLIIARLAHALKVEPGILLLKNKTDQR